MKHEEAFDGSVHVPRIIRLNREWSKNRKMGPPPEFTLNPPIYGLLEPTLWQRIKWGLGF